MAKMPPCDMLALTAWDQRYSTTLPDSIRDFYLARCHHSTVIITVIIISIFFTSPPAMVSG